MIFQSNAPLFFSYTNLGYMFSMPFSSLLAYLRFFFQTLSKKVELFEQLLKTISCAERQHKTGGDQREVERRLEVVQDVSRLVTTGAPLQPVGGHTVYPLHLAISSNCTDLVPLLLSVGAPLTSTTGRLGILQQAWLSPDVTTNIAVIVTRVSFFVSNR